MLAQSTCSINGCERPLKARSWCAMHWMRWHRTGDPEQASRIYGPAPLRFWTRVDFTDSCWLWAKRLQADGYGSFSIESGRTVLAHRWAYEFIMGAIPTGLTLDHLCRVRHCVNPEHLEPVTAAVNTMRGYGAGAIHARQTHCIHGHILSGDNIYLTPRGHRVCRHCHKGAVQRYLSKLALNNLAEKLT